MPSSLNLPEPTFDGAVNNGVSAVIEGCTCTITLSSPDNLNAQTPSMWAQLEAIGTGIPQRVSVIVIRGQGQAFSAGLDRSLLTGPAAPGEQTLPQLAEGPPDVLDAFIAQAQSGFAWLRSHRAISIAVVHGHAIGAGFQLALAADLRIASEDASFAMKEIAFGIVPDLGGTGVLVQQVGYARALQICATGLPISGKQAEAWGIVQHAVPKRALDATVDSLVAHLSTLHPNTLAAVKVLLAGAEIRDFEAQLDVERITQVKLLTGQAFNGR